MQCGLSNQISMAAIAPRPAAAMEKCQNAVKIMKYHVLYRDVLRSESSYQLVTQYWRAATVCAFTEVAVNSRFIYYKWEVRRVAQTTNASAEPLCQKRTIASALYM